MSPSLRASKDKLKYYKDKEHVNLKSYLIHHT